MEPFQPKFILCPTDFSEPATLVLYYGKKMADCFGPRLIVLYANPFTPPPHFTSGQVDELVKAIEHSKGAARNSWFVMCASISLILSYLKPWCFNRFLLGSVTERILHETDRPVLTVCERKGTAEPSRVSIQQVLCPINYTEVAPKALEHAVAISKCFGAELLVLHVIESRSSDVKEEVEHGRLCAWVSDDIRSRCSLKEIVRRGDGAEKIIKMAQDQAIDLIVLGSQHKRFPDTTVIGTTTVRVTRHAPCPVLTVIRK